MVARKTPPRAASRQTRLPTRSDVARLAGTSTAVVSYVVNGGPRPVSDSTRGRVLQAIKTLGYRPNAVARSLRARRSSTIGLIVPDLANPFFGELARSVEVAGFDCGNALLVGNSMGEEEREYEYVRTFLEYRIGGLIVAPVGQGRASRAQLRTADVPVVVLDRFVPGLRVATVVPDNVEGAAAATEHLLSHGYDNVACVAGPEGLPGAEERVQGWSRALDAAGVPAKKRVVVRAAFGRRDGYRAARLLLERKRRPRAIFVASDEQAFGVLRAAARHGARVPQDLALVGFDGLDHGAYTVPGLTTMQQPIGAAGRLAVQTLLDGSQSTRKRSLTRLPVTLRRRGSCGCDDNFDEGGADE